jgi:hypothetical protein
MSTATGNLPFASQLTLSARTTLSPLEKAILLTVHYRDLFAHALTEAEILKFLIGLCAERVAVNAALRGLTETHLSITNGLVTWQGREHLAVERRRRVAASARLWTSALSYAGIVRRIPFVRMVGVSGSLAINHADEHHDVDLFCIAEAGRVWLAMFFLRALRVYSQRHMAVGLCPNTCLGEDTLQIHDHNLYMAHQIAHLVPLWGQATYERFVDQNSWVDRFLPNALKARPASRMRFGRPLLQNTCEALFSGHLGDVIDRGIYRAGYRKGLRFYSGTYPESVVRQARHRGRYMLPGLGYTAGVQRRFMRGHASRFMGILSPAEMAATFGCDAAALDQDDRLDVEFEARYGRAPR